MITNVIAFLSSIATAILIGVGLVSLNIKYKHNARLDELSGLLTTLINTSNTQAEYINLNHRFANLQEAYYAYKQNHGTFLSEQAEAVELITNLKKLLYVSLSIWVFESILILISGKNIFEYAVATLIIAVLVAIFTKFSTKFKYFVGDFSLGDGDFPRPENLLNPTNLLSNKTFAYISPQLSLNLMEAGIAIEFDPPKNAESYTDPSQDDAENEPVIHDYSDFFATGRLLFAFNYSFSGELHFYTKHGDDGNPFSVSSEYFKAGLSNIYDIGFSYNIPLHHLEKVVLVITNEKTGEEYGSIAFIVPRFEDFVTRTITLTQSIATRKNA